MVNRIVYIMKDFLRILVIAAMAMAVACQTDTPVPTPEPEPGPGPGPGPEPTPEFTLNIEVTDITAYNAQLTITPSNDEDEYACVFISAEQQPVEVDDYDQMLIIIGQFMPAVFTGPLTQAPLTPLMPETEYVVLAFGIDTATNLPTTDLYEVRFTSKKAAESKAGIKSIELIKLFDAEAIIAIDRSYRQKLGDCECIGIVEAKANAQSTNLYFWWYETWMKVEYSYEAFLEDLLMYPPANNPEIMDMHYSLDADDTFFFAGIAEDDKGNLSEIFFGEDIQLSTEMVSPAEEFFEMIKEASPSTFIIAR